MSHFRKLITLPDPFIDQSDRPHILVVDDEPTTRQMLRTVLSGDYRVSCAEDGRSACEHIRSGAFDLVLLDVMMPVMNGLDVLRFIRSRSDTAELPVMLLSAMSHDDDVVTGLELGANDYITKPISMRVLLARVKTQITLKRLMDDRRQAIELLESSQQLRSRLMRIASHDLKNPLNNVRSLEFLMREKLAGTVPAEWLDTLRSSISMMQDVISGFLDMELDRDGMPELTIDRIPVEKVVWDVVVQYGVAALNKGIALEVEDLDGVAMADYERLKQIISNLLSNAVKFSPQDRTVHVYARTMPDDRLRIYVEDEGPGIPEDERHLLFREFSRLSTRPTAEEGSTGLGLWIAGHLATLQGGQIGADFPEEGGSAFWVELPAVHTEKKLHQYASVG